ncbi:MAG: glucans biosynthesis glucosyltransferase MdoH [Defluviicoccus sp.]
MDTRGASPVDPAIAAVGGDSLAFDPPTPVLRRLAFFSIVAITVVLAVMMLAEILGANGLQVIEVFILVVFFFNFLLITLSFWTAAAGFAVRALNIDPINLRPVAKLLTATSGSITTRTAITIPVYNEDPHRVFAGLEATYSSLEAAGGLEHFEIFVLSDTTRDDIAALERRYWVDFCIRMNAGNRVFYRRRESNTGRKAGNIADFCNLWGHRYDHMVILDADSVMSGEALVAMVRLMEANPQAGLIQSQPIPVRQETLFGRALQFGTRLVSPMLSSGLSFWHVGESNYWGHNAIIRTGAFIAHCGLPTLSGNPPLGGEIHSHDFVEAALLRRGGWRVYFVPELKGSYEELPGNILDYATRDRRWCQGNLQHLKLLGASGFHPLSRLHLLQGAFSYLASPLWAAFLLLSTADVIEKAITGHRYFTGIHQLHPSWPISKLTETLSLFAVTMAMLFLPKVLALLILLFDHTERRLFGGGRRVTLSVLGETLFSILIAPVMGGLHTYFVASLLLGRGVGWKTQNRSDRGLTVKETVSSLGVLFAIGIAWLLVLVNNAPSYIWWVLPLLTGLILAVPISVLSSRPSVGGRLREWDLLLTPEETSPPVELADLASALLREPPADEPLAGHRDFVETPPTRNTPMHSQSLFYEESELDTNASKGAAGS